MAYKKDLAEPEKKQNLLYPIQDQNFISFSLMGLLEQHITKTIK
jgi:hypothetical protein